MLKITHFSKRYGKATTNSVTDLNLELKPGEVFGFLGPNGAGKSTTIKSIIGVLPFNEGTIEVCGVDIKKHPLEAKMNIGYVPDNHAVFERLTGREYINHIANIYGVSMENAEKRADQYVKMFGLEKAYDNPIHSYSHGMKQKITVIGALVHNPKLWILDEPLTGLDPTSIYQVKQCMINHAKEGNIVFFSSHLIDIVEKLCDRVGVIKKGEIQRVDTVANIEKEYGTLEKYYLSVIGDTVTKAGE